MARMTTDSHILYNLTKQLTTHFVETPAYKLGIIDKNGNVLKPLKTLKTPQEKKAWSEWDIVINNIKRVLVKVPRGYNKVFTDAAGLFLLREPLSKIREAAELPEEVLAYNIFEASNYLDNAVTEDAPANAAGTGGVAGIGVGPYGEPGYTAKKKFRGCKVFEVDFDTFYRVRFGKNRYHTYKRYVGEDEVGQDIRNFGRSNPGEGIILQNPTTEVMTFLKFPTKYKDKR